MLIRFATHDDKNDWLDLAKDVAPVFEAPDMPDDPRFHAFMDAKLNQFEAICAQDRMSGALLGLVTFSRSHNRISWMGIFEAHRGKGMGTKLLSCAINQLDPEKEVMVETFAEGNLPGLPARRLYKKFGFEDAEASSDPYGNQRSKMRRPPSKAGGGSFHYRYGQYARWANKANCPVCNNENPEHPPVLIMELEHAWVECYYEAQGCLFGKCHVLSKIHSEHFYDMPADDMACFMADVQKAAKALHNVTGAVKINYEIHGNSMPHLHAHLFPRYLDDAFPSAPIDYRIISPSPYESVDEFDWFVSSMRKLLGD